MTSYTVMQFVDKFMVAHVSPLQLAAHGNGSVWAFVPIVVAFGLLTVVNTWVSQNLGAGRPQDGPKYAWAAIWLAVAAWAWLLLPSAALAGSFFGFIHDDPELVRMEAGYCRIVDRVKELIKYKGFQVAPAELEAVLLMNPRIKDAAVVPSPDEHAGEVPKAFVVSDGSLTEADVIAFVAQRVSVHKKIRRVEFIDAIPKSPSGKILRRVLVDRERQRSKRA